MSGDWFDLLAEARAAGVPHVLVTITQAAGSTPREAGAKMTVTADAMAGTIGGGHLEHVVIGRARELLAQGASAPETSSFPLGPALGQCCGGSVSVLLEPFAPPGLHVSLFGAGHVARRLIEVLAGCPVRVDWIDARDQAFPSDLPGFVKAIPSDDPAGEVGLLPPGSHLLVMTHSHALDFDILAAALRRGGFASIGVIGSASKWQGFRRRLIERGLPEPAVDAVQCPIGLPGISGKRPAEIAISVAAWLLSQSSQENR